MRLTLLVVVLAGAVMTTACSALLPPQAAPCSQEKSDLDNMNERNDLAAAEALDAGIKVLNAQGDALNAASAVSNAQTELAAAKLNGGAQAPIEQAIADATAKAAKADAVVKAAQDDETQVKALADADTKALTAARSKFNACQQHN